MKISIIIPVFHEEKNIEKVLREISKKIKTEHEVLVVYDTPKDPTVPVVKKFSRKSKQQTRLIKNIFGSGKGVMNAIKTGFASAKGDAIVVVMADLSDDISQIDSMFRYIQKGYSVVCASRFMKGGKKIGGTFLKTFLSKLAGKSLHLLLGVPTHDLTNAYKMYRKKIFEKIHIESTGGFEYSLEITLKAFFAGFTITEIPTVWKDREAGKSNFKLWKWLPQYIRWYVWGLWERFGLSFIYFAYIVSAVFITTLQVGGQLKSKIPIESGLDLSWQTDAVERLLHGFIAGRDYIFTYGPLFQFLHSLPALLWHVPSFVSVSLASILLSIVVSTSIIFTTASAAESRRDKIILPMVLLFVIGVIPVLSGNIGVRVLLPLIYSCLWINPILAKQISFKRIVLLSILPTVFGAYVYDLFPQTILLGVLGLGYIVGKRKESMWQKLLALSVFVIGIVVFQFLTSFIISGSLSYTKDSLTTLSDYLYIMNTAWEAGKSNYLFVFPIIGFVLTWVLLKNKDLSIRIKTAAIILEITALTQLRTALVRSDSGHILSALYPSIIVTFILLYFLFKTKKAIYVGLFVFLFILIPFKDNVYSYLSAKNIGEIGYLLKNEQRTLFEEIYTFPSSFKVSAADREVLLNFIASHKGQVMVYPYDSVLLNTQSTTFNTFALQFYDYSNSSVEKKSVVVLKKSPPQYIILQVDGDSTFALDGTPNFTRNPLIAQWMLQNYTIFKKVGSVLILSYTPQKHEKLNAQMNVCNGFLVQGDFRSTDLLHFVKPSQYYFIYHGALRLPVKPGVDAYTIISGNNSIDSLSKLFNSSINFSNKVEDKNLEQEAKVVSVDFLSHVTFYPDAKIFCFR